MDILALREPINSLTHAAGFVFAIIGTVYLLGSRQTPPERRISLLIFGLSLAGCYAASSHYHGSLGGAPHIGFLQRLDHVGIYCLIAGTYTPIASSLLGGKWKRITLTCAWVAAASGSAVILICGVLPTALSTLIYLGLGWGAIFVYREIRRRHPHRILRPLLHGGIAYTVGAGFNLLHWPRSWPWLLGSHEIFHVFVLVGSYWHFVFIASIVGHEKKPRPAAPTVPARSHGVSSLKPTRRFGNGPHGQLFRRQASRFALRSRGR